MGLVWLDVLSTTILTQINYLFFVLVVFLHVDHAQVM